MKLHHIAIACENPSSQALFYSEVFNLNQIREDSDSGSVWLFSNDVILMFENTTGEGFQTEPPGYHTRQKGYHLLAFSIEVEKRDAFKKKLEQRGIQVVDESRYTLYFYDPEKNRVAVSHYPTPAN